jgi:hypothetical protein
MTDEQAAEEYKETVREWCRKHITSTTEHGLIVVERGIGFLAGIEHERNNWLEYPKNIPKLNSLNWITLDTGIVVDKYRFYKENDMGWTRVVAFMNYQYPPPYKPKEG